MGAAILAELVVILLNIAVRVVTGDSVLWTQEVSEIALLTIAFIGGAIAYPKGAHMSVQALIMRLPATWKPYLAALVDWLVFVMSAGAFALFVPTLAQQIEEKTPDPATARLLGLDALLHRHGAHRVVRPRQAPAAGPPAAS